MTKFLTLEDFAKPHPAAPLPTRVEDLPGYDAGYAAAMADSAAVQTRLSDDTVQAISDITFGFAEARLYVMAGLVPLFQILVDRLMPTSLPHSFRAQVVARLTDAARSDISHPFRVTLNPCQIAAISNVLPPTIGRLVVLDSDPALSPHSALISAGETETALDYDTLHADIAKALAALFDTLTESHAHG